MIGFLRAAEPERFGCGQVHVWSYDRLLRALPERSWLVRHNPQELERGILTQISWQRWQLHEEVGRAGCGILLNTDAGTVSKFRPSVTMSRDMLSYEPGEIGRYGWSKARVRLWLLRHMRNRSLRAADGAIFLTHYAARIIQASCGELKNIAIVPHGVRDEFRDLNRTLDWPEPGTRDLRCLYVSNAAPYKHQWEVVRAVEALRREGYRVSLKLVGGGQGKSQVQLEAQIARSDPEGCFVTQTEFLPHDALLAVLEEADLFIFASSCENMPNTLVEGMAAGLPIACSARGPMPEVLRDGGVFFDPENDQSIAKALRRLIDSSDLRRQVAARGRALANDFSWKRCANETFAFVAETHRKCTT